MKTCPSNYHFSSVYFREEEYQVVTENAKTLGVSRNALIKKALANYFEKLNADGAHLKPLNNTATDTAPEASAASVRIDYKEEGL